jgi:hypothetical protein
MTCSRCAGLMVEDYLINIDIDAPSGDERLSAWRCVNCGDIVEQHMIANRLVSPSGSSRIPEGQKSALDEPGMTLRVSA